MELHACSFPGQLIELCETSRVVPLAGGAVVVLAELVNTASQTISDIKAHVSLKDELAALLDVQEHSVGCMYPGQRLPFKVALASLDGEPVLAQLSVSYAAPDYVDRFKAPSASAPIEE